MATFFQTSEDVLLNFDLVEQIHPPKASQKAFVVVGGSFIYLTEADYKEIKEAIKKARSREIKERIRGDK